MDRTKAAAIHYPEKVDKVVKAEDMATAEAIAAVALLQVITMAEAKIRLNPNSQALTSNTHEISKTCTADKSSSRDLIHAWTFQESTTKEKLPISPVRSIKNYPQSDRVVAPPWTTSVNNWVCKTSCTVLVLTITDNYRSDKRTSAKVC